MSKPNVIVIISDQHRGDWTGSRIVETPHMDAMAAQGTSFTRAYCNSPLCVPSRMSMLTGLYPHATEVYANDDMLRSDLPTWAHAFGLGGYETVLCGRMHFVGPDQRHGFERRLVGDITHGYPGGPRTDYGALQGASGQGLRSIRTAGPGHSPVLEFDEQVVRASVRLLAERATGHAGGSEAQTGQNVGPLTARRTDQQHNDQSTVQITNRHAEQQHNDQSTDELAARRTDQQHIDQSTGPLANRRADERTGHHTGLQADGPARPLLLCVGLYGPHHPYVCPAPYYERAREAMKSADALPPPDEMPLHPWYAEWRERLGAGDISEEQLLTARACYAGLISLTDTYVGRILHAAKQLPGETIVVYTSDHGDMAGDRGMFWKRNMLEGAIRVPLFMCSLNGSRASEQSDLGNGSRKIEQSPDLGNDSRASEQRSDLGNDSRAGGPVPDIPRGRRIDAPVSLIDLAPTFASWAGAPPLPQQAGRDLTPLLAEHAAVHALPDWRERPVYVELANEKDGILRAVIRDHMKLVYFAGWEEHLLFDLQRDPAERHNVWADESYAKARATLLTLLDLDGWDPRRIQARLETKEPALRYLTRWGKEVGMGPLDLWNQPAGDRWRYGRTEEARS